jgi:hypothetical protein
MLSLHVLTDALGGTDVVDQVVELIQISGDTPSSVGGPSQARGKLAGIQLGHFGAFYRRSWRANDWMQGRLDGARRIAQLVVSPQRLRTIAWDPHPGSAAQAAATAIRRMAYESVPDQPLRTVLRDRYDTASVARELEYLDHPDVPPPEMLPTCVEAVARRLQLEILLEELPLLS